MYAKIVNATPMNTTPHATMSPFTLVIVVVVAASTGNTCAMASPAMSSNPNTNSPIVLNISITPSHYVVPSNSFTMTPTVNPPRKKAPAQYTSASIAA